MSDLTDYQKEALTNGEFPSERIQVNSKHSERIDSIPDMGIYTNGAKAVNWLLGFMPFMAFFSEVSHLVHKGKKHPLPLMKASNGWFFRICMTFDFFIRIFVVCLVISLICLIVYFFVKAKIQN